MKERRRKEEYNKGGEEAKNIIKWTQKNEKVRCTTERGGNEKGSAGEREALTEGRK